MLKNEFEFIKDALMESELSKCTFYLNNFTIYLCPCGVMPCFSFSTEQEFHQLTFNMYCSNGCRSKKIKIDLFDRYDPYMEQIYFEKLEDLVKLWNDGIELK